jgi:hypothetical protein
MQWAPVWYRTVSHASLRAVFCGADPGTGTGTAAAAATIDPDPSACACTVLREGAFTLAEMSEIRAMAVDLDGPYLFACDGFQACAYDIECDFAQLRLWPDRQGRYGNADPDDAVPPVTIAVGVAVCEGFVLIADARASHVVMFDARRRAPADWAFAEPFGGDQFRDLRDISAAATDEGAGAAAGQRWVCTLEDERIQLFAAVVESDAQRCD